MLFFLVGGGFEKLVDTPQFPENPTGHYKIYPDNVRVFD